MRVSTPVTRPPVSLVRVTVALVVTTLVLGGIGAALRDQPDDNSMRVMVLGFGGALLSGFVITGIACFRDIIWRHLLWAIPALWVASALACAATLPADAPAADYIMPAALPPLVMMIGVLVFLIIGWPLAILGISVVKPGRYPASLVWGCAAAITFAGTYPFVAAAVATPRSLTRWGQGGEILGAVLGLNDLPIENETALWFTRAFLALSIAVGLIALVQAKRERAR